MSSRVHPTVDGIRGHRVTTETEDQTRLKLASEIRISPDALASLKTEAEAMTRHLIGGGPNRRDVLTECSLDSVLPETLVTELEDMTCRDCRWSLVGRGICPECGEERLVWSAGPVNRSGVADGRLTMRDVVSEFYLGCEGCSETLVSGVHPDVVAAKLTKMGWRLD